MQPDNEGFMLRHSSQLVWGLTLAVPAVYDAWALSTKHETMSQAFREAYNHPIYKFLCIGSLGGLAVHLLQSTGDQVPSVSPGTGPA